MLNESRKSERKAARRKKLGPRPNFPEGQASDDVTPAHNPHGSGGEERGIKKKDRKVPKVMPKYASRKAKMEMSHTVYQDMGYLMAESLGLVSEATRKDTYGGTGPDRMSKTPFKRKESSESESPYKKKLARQTAQQTPAERQKDVEDVYTRSAQRRRAGTGERRYVAAMLNDPKTKKTIKPAEKGPKTIKGRRRAR